LMALMFTLFGERGTTAALLAGAAVAIIAGGVSCTRLLKRNRQI